MTLSVVGGKRPAWPVAWTVGSTVALATSLYLALLAWYATHQGRGALSETVLRKTDFLEIYSVGKLILRRQGGSIYDPPTLARLEMSIQHAHDASRAVLPYLDQPFFALLVAPLALLPYLHAYSIWLAFNCLVLSAVLVALLRYAAIPLAALPYLAVAALLCPPVALALSQGQVSIVALALVAVALIAARHDRDRIAGVALGLALLKPPFSLVLLLVFALRGRWGAVYACVATFLVEVAFSVAVLGPGAIGGFVRLLANVWSWQGRTGPVAYMHVRIATATYSARQTTSLSGILLQMFSPGVARVLTAASAVLLLSVLVWCERRAQPIEVPLALAVAISLLLSPHVLTHDLSLILVPLAVCWRYRAASIRRLPLLLVATYAILVLGFFLSLFVPFQLDAGAGLIVLAVLLGETAHLHDIRPRVVGAAVAR